MTLPILCLCLLVQQPQAPLAPAASVSATTGGLKAEVRGSRGAPVPGVQIRLTHRDGRVWATLTDEQGHFQAGGLPPGEDPLESRLAGFRGEVCPLQIRAQAWLQGVPNRPPPLRDAGARVLRFRGPGTYEAAPGLIQLQQRPELGKIPMH